MFRLLILTLVSISMALPAQAARKKLTLHELNHGDYEDMDFTDDFVSAGEELEDCYNCEEPNENKTSPMATLFGIAYKAGKTSEVKTAKKAAPEKKVKATGAQNSKSEVVKKPKIESSSTNKSTGLFSAKSSHKSEKKEEVAAKKETKKDGDLKTDLSKAFPIAGRAFFIAGLGVARSGGRRHAGVDWGAKMGTPIAAAWDGKVVAAYYDRLGGWAVKIVHPNGLSTYYAHLERKPDVRQGQKVKAGEIIGTVGMSGNAKGTQPHLHFEVRRKRQILNPLNYFSKANVIKTKS